MKNALHEATGHTLNVGNEMLPIDWVATLDHSFARIVGQDQYNDLNDEIGTGFDSIYGGCLRLAIYTTKHLIDLIETYEGGVFEYDALEWYAPAKEGQFEMLPEWVFRRMLTDDHYALHANYVEPAKLRDWVLQWLQVHGEQLPGDLVLKVKKPRPLEIHSIPVISTAHITREVNDQLLADDNPWALHANLGGCGFFIFLDDLIDPAPQCLKDLRDWLRKKEDAGIVDNSRWLRLDSDGQIVEGLPTYDW